MMTYARPRTKYARSLTYKTPPAQSFSAHTMRWECAGAERLIAGFAVPEELVPPADDSEQLVI